MKNEMRKIYKNKRSLMTCTEVSEKSSSACSLFLKSDVYKNANEIMIYMPLGNETDTTLIINKAFADGKKLIFPVTDSDTGEITPCYATSDTHFKRGAFSVKEPDVLNPANPEDIDIIIVPGIVFDAKGTRIGFGKGCYDRLLCNTKAVKIGFCYDWQVCSEIPAEEYDVKMDYIFTEKRMISIK